MSYAFNRDRSASRDRYPRTLAEAFPDERAQCIEGPLPVSRFDRIAGYVLAVSIGIALALVIASRFV